MPVKATSTLQVFCEFLKRERGLRFSDFEALHRWSVEDQSAFWEAVWRFDGFDSPTRYSSVLSNANMPGASWFPGAQVNYARQIFRHVERAEAAGQPAVIAEDERGPVETVGWSELQRRAASMALELRRLGVARGDRVVAYLPNRPEAIVALLACASIGAIWAICAPDMGVPAVIDRFRQIEPKLLIATDGVTYGGKSIDRTRVVEDIRASLPTVEHLVLVDSRIGNGRFGNAIYFSDLIAGDDARVRAFKPEWLPFDHPLWILYSSGTTGKPKALVHSHGGILLNEAAARLHFNMGASYKADSFGERFHWFCSTGWMMWNAQVGGLLGGTTICIYDGNPSGSKDNMDWATLWRFAARNYVTFFGAGAAFYTMCVKGGLDLASVGDLSALGALGSTASPLPADVQLALSDRLKASGYPDICWFNSSGGTDICGAFCTANSDLPPTPGKLQCRQLGAAVESWSPDGRPVIGEVGELVCTRPMPSMPLFLWGDEDGSRYHQSYFDTYPGVWRHGDWIKIEVDGTCEIFGRSDATINRGGHRLGTSEIYDAVERLDAVADSMAIDVRVGGDSQLLLFVVPANGMRGAALANAVCQAIRSSLSPRFVPDKVIEVSGIPRTLSGKKQELPVKRLFEGRALAEVADLSAMANPDVMQEFLTLACDLSAAQTRTTIA
jgi:acetoacetyl-CoA synthetase